MKKIPLTPLFALCITLLLVACQSENSEQKKSIFSLEHLPSTTFNILGNQDTVLEGKQGVRLYIPANAFMDKNGNLYTGDVNIELLECLTLEDIIKADLETVTADGQILESSGMFRIRIKGTEGLELAIIPDAKVKITIPNNGKKGALLFYGQTKDGRLTWTASHLLDGDSTNYWHAKGRELLFEHCAACHNVDLVSDMTGPALAWVSKRWDKMSNLILFTKNSDLLAHLGHPRAKYMLNWSASSMTHFDHLSDEEIKAIYNYIDEECLRRKIDSTELGQSMSDAAYRYFNRQDSIDAASNQYSFILNGTAFLSTGWINIDSYLRMENLRQINFSAKIEGESFVGKTRLKLIFPNRNSVIHAFYDNSNKSYTLLPNTTQIGLPIGEEAYLLAVSTLDKEAHYALKKIIIGKNESETMVLKESTFEEIMDVISKEF